MEPEYKPSTEPFSGELFKAQRYEYTELPPSCIRLLRLKTPRFSYQECELRSFPLGNLPKYHTLSYCWGDPARNNILICDESKILITITLLGALEQLQTLERTNVQWIWIDQICINQDNNQERGAQVNVMKDVYENSEGTIIWLGPGIPGIESTARLLEDMYELHGRDQNPNASRKRKPYTADEYKSLDLPPATDQSWKALAELLARPWFVRTWVIQEATLSKSPPRMICGSYELNWGKMLGSCSWMAWMGYQLTPLALETRSWPAIISLNMFNDLKSIDLPWDLTTLLPKAVKFKATEPRDKVYSLFGLAGETQDSSNIPSALQANYDKPIRDVFRDITRHIIESSKKLCVLSLMRSTPNWEDFPSWTVDFAADAQWDRISYFAWNKHIRGWNASRETPNKASGDLFTELLPTSFADVLALKGTIIDTIDTPCDIMHQYNLSSSGTEILLPWRRAYQQSRVRYPAIEALGRAFITTLTANWSLTEIDLTSHEPLHHFWAYLKRAYESQLKETISHDHRAEIQREFQEVLELGNSGDGDMYRLHTAAANHRRIFFTENTSYIGLGPGIMQQNDMLCVLFGGATPHILRPDGEQFRYVGECYVHGLMDGEAIRDLRAGKYVELIFHLI